MKKILLFCAVLAALICFSTEAEAQNRDSVSAAEVNGTFRNEAGSEFKILALGAGRLRVAFSGVYEYRTGNGEMMANTGEAEGAAEIEGDTAVFEPDETEGCTITLVFLRGGRLEVEQEGDSADCGFGNNVSAEGMYKKVSSAKPKF